MLSYDQALKDLADYSKTIGRLEAALKVCRELREFDRIEIDRLRKLCAERPPYIIPEPSITK